MIILKDGVLSASIYFRRNGVLLLLSQERRAIITFAGTASCATGGGQKSPAGRGFYLLIT